MMIKKVKNQSPIKPTLSTGPEPTNNDKIKEASLDPSSEEDDIWDTTPKLECIDLTETPKKPCSAADSQQSEETVLSPQTREKSCSSLKTSIVKIEPVTKDKRLSIKSTSTLPLTNNEEIKITGVRDHKDKNKNFTMKRDAYGDDDGPPQSGMYDFKMKRDRDSYDEDGPNQKRQRQLDEEVTFLIPSKVAGSIIGKGGANISKLRNQVRPILLYLQTITALWVLAIAAPDVDTVLEIVKEILPCLADGGPKANNEELDVRLLIHQSRAGCVIGKAGAKIKELREKTGARLKIFSNPAPQSTERVVQLIGKSESVAAGVREVLDLVRQVPIKGAVQNYDPHNYDDFYAEEYGGFGNGQGARGPRGAPPRPPPMGPRARLPPPRAGPPMARTGPPGPRGGFNDFAGPPPRGNFSGPPRGGFGGGNFGGGNFGGGRAAGGFGGDSSSQQETTTQVTIPKDLAGAIIGKAGSRIRKIRAESGAGIEIAEPLPGSSDRIITITGTPQRIQMAQYLLQQSVHESNPNLGRGNF